MAKKGKKSHAARAKAKAEESTAASPPTGDARKGVKGLKNLGNTCYVNSVVQCMHAATEFRESLPTGTNGNSMCSSLGSVLKSMSGPGAAVGPKALHTTFCNKFPWFKGHQQHDAHEFFCTLVGAVADEKPKNGKATTAVEKEDSGEEQPSSGEAAAQNFQGQICSTFLCWKCKRISMRVCPYFHLSVPVPECDSECGLLGLPVELQQMEFPAAPEAAEAPEVGNEAPAVSVSAVETETSPVVPAPEESPTLPKPDIPVETVETVPSLPSPAVTKEAKETCEAEVQTDDDETYENMENGKAPSAHTLNGKTEVDKSQDPNGACQHPPEEVNGNAVEADPETKEVADTKHQLNGNSCKAPNNGDTVKLEKMDDEMEKSEKVSAPPEELPEETPELGSDDAWQEGAALAEQASPDGEDATGTEVKEVTDPPENDNVDSDNVDNEEANEAPAENEGPFSYQVLLRSEKTGKQDYGFKWNMSALSKDQLIVASINPDSIVDTWNLKQLTMGQVTKVVRPGDQIFAVNGETIHKDMLKLLKQEPEVTLTILRTDLEAPVEMPQMSMNHDKEDKEDEEERVERRKALLEAWKGCQDGLPEELQSMYSGQSLGIKGDSCSLMDCLQKFAGVEAMEEDFHPSYDCSDCAKKAAEDVPENGNAKKKPKMYATSKSWLCGTMPKLLTVQLKRFNRKLQKIKTRVAVPSTLDLSDLMMTPEIAKNVKEHLKTECAKQDLPISPDENASYELFGIVQHHGSTLQGGHYTAYVNLGRNLEEGNWYFCNDANVTKCSLEDALKAETYVAFYRKIASEDAD